MLRLLALVHLGLVDRRGVTALEYGLIAAVVGAVMVVGARSLGTSLSGKFSALAGSI